MMVGRQAGVDLGKLIGSTEFRLYRQPSQHRSDFYTRGLRVLA